MSAAPKGRDGGRGSADVAPERPWFRRVPWKKTILIGAGGGFAVLVIGIGAIYASTDVPAASEVSTAQATVIRYADGSEMATLGANRVDVPLSDVPEPVQKAVLAAEDRNYYSEPGISPTGILRAAFANLKGGGISQGASTITQQYAKNAYLSQERTFTRKFKEIFLAVKLDRTRSKDQVLGDYLNTVYFGRGALGIETAAKAYFGVSAKDLTAQQGIVLAELLRGPALYDPAAHPERAQQRYTYVYDGMKAEGWLPAGTPDTLPKVLPVAESRDQLAGPVGYLVRQAEAELATQGFDEAYVRQSGLDITTTIDKKKQDAAVKAVDGVLGKLPGDLLAPLVAVEPSTGRIVAEYAGADYNADQFNAVTDAVAQAGSTFKAYVLAAALKQGITLTTQYDGSSPKDVKGYTKPVYNFGSGNGEQFGNIDLVTATAHSVNTVFVPLAIDAGIDNVATTAEDLGIRASDVDVKDLGASLALGSASVHPIDQVTAFAALANHGTRVTPHILDSVRTHDGKVLAQVRPKESSAVDATVADETTYALEHVVSEGTATGAQLDGGRPAAGKTGTTQNSEAAWFAGYTPQLAAVTALFHRDSAVPVENVAGVSGQVTGGSLPAKVWKAFMDAALVGEPVEQFADVTLPAPQQASTSPTASPSASPSPSESPSPSPSPTPSEIVPSLPPITSSPTPPPPSSSPSASSPPPSASPTPAASPAALQSPAAASSPTAPAG